MHDAHALQLQIRPCSQKTFSQAQTGNVIGLPPLVIQTFIQQTALKTHNIPGSLLYNRDTAINKITAFNE